MRIEVPIEEGPEAKVVGDQVRRGHPARGRAPQDRRPAHGRTLRSHRGRSGRAAAARPLPHARASRGAGQSAPRAGADPISRSSSTSRRGSPRRSAPCEIRGLAAHARAPRARPAHRAQAGPAPRSAQARLRRAPAARPRGLPPRRGHGAHRTRWPRSPWSSRRRAPYNVAYDVALQRAGRAQRLGRRPGPEPVRTRHHPRHARAGRPLHPRGPRLAAPAYRVAAGRPDDLRSSTCGRRSGPRSSPGSRRGAAAARRRQARRAGVQLQQAVHRFHPVRDPLRIPVPPPDVPRAGIPAGDAHDPRHRGSLRPREPAAGGVLSVRTRSPWTPAPSTPRVVHDTRDNPLNPTRGSFISLNLSYVAPGAGRRLQLRAPAPAGLVQLRRSGGR